MVLLKSLYRYGTMSTRTGKIIHWPIKLLPHNTRFPILTGQLKGMRWFVKSGMITQWLGIYEKKKLALVTGFLKEGMTVFDVGAHVGFYTLLFAKYAGSKGRVFAFEPLPENASWLVKHIRLNHIEHNSVVCSAAVSSRNRICSFEIREHSAIGGLSANQSGSVLMVPVFSLDSFCDGGADNGPVPIPDIVKMDIEGEESRALEGSTDILSKRKTTWFVALHSQKAFVECLRIFNDYGYDVFSLDKTRITDADSEIDEIYAIPRCA